MITLESDITNADSRTVVVWDPFVRIFHWSLATFFLVAYLTEDELQTTHVYAGYAVALLVLFRLVWGAIGPRHARFGDFVTSPRSLARYLGQLAGGRAPRHLGHNPAGAAMIVALIVALSLATGSGMLLYGGDGLGPLGDIVSRGFSGEWLEEVHEFFANTTLALVLLHVAGVVVSSIAHRENLVRAMITGRKSAS